MTIHTEDKIKTDKMTANEARRNMLKITAGVVALGAGSLATTQAMAQSAVSITEEWDKTFAKSDKVAHKKVTFKNRYGITLVGDLYQPKDASGKLAAIAVGG